MLDWYHSHLWLLLSGSASHTVRCLGIGNIMATSLCMCYLQGSNFSTGVFIGRGPILYYISPEHCVNEKVIAITIETKSEKVQ